MKKKLFVKGSALLLAAALLLAPAACSTQEGSSGGTEGSPASGVSASQTGSGPYGLDPNKRVTLSCFYDFTWYPISEWKGIIADEITKLTGVDMELTIAVDGQQLGVMIASGELPDLVSSDHMFSNLSTNELCYDWQSLIDQYGLDWDVGQQAKANALSFTQEEGKYFTVLSHFATEEDWKELDQLGVGAPMCGTMLYRHDLYEEMGSPKLETLEDVRAVLQQVKETYPDLKPLVFDPVTWKFTYFRQAFGLGNGSNYYIQQDDGNWATVVKDPRYKEYLAYVNQLYRDGLFTADNYGMEGTAAEAEVDAGGTFSYLNGTQNTITTRNGALRQNVPGAELWEAPMVGDPKGAYDASIGWMGTFISKNCSDPETAIRYMQFIHSEEGARLTQWGREGQEYTLDENGAPVFSDEWNQAIDDGKLDEIYNTALYQGGTKINEAVARCAPIDPKMVPNYETLRQNFSNKPWIKYAEPKEGSDEKIILDQLFDGSSGAIPTGEAKVILSDTPEDFEKNFQALLDTCAAVGMDELETYMDEHIKEAMKVYGVS